MAWILEMEVDGLGGFLTSTARLRCPLEGGLIPRGRASHVLGTCFCDPLSELEAQLKVWNVHRSPPLKEGRLFSKTAKSVRAGAADWVPGAEAKA